MEQDKDNISSKAWQGTGKRESRTILHELGVSIKEDDLDYVVRSIYVLGHIHGYNYTARKNLDIEKLEQKIQQQEIDIAMLQSKAEQCELLEEDVASKKDRIDDLHKELRKYKGLYDLAEEKVKRMDEENSALVTELEAALGEETEEDRNKKEFLREMATLGILSLKNKTSDKPVSERVCASMVEDAIKIDTPRSYVQKIKRKYADGYFAEVVNDERLPDNDGNETGLQITAKKEE